MNSREKILAAVRNNQPALVEMPEMGDGELPAGEVTDLQAMEEEGMAGQTTAGGVIAGQGLSADGLAREFGAMLEAIGGISYIVSGFEDIIAIINDKFGGTARIISNCAELAGLATGEIGEDPHALADTDLAILRGQFGVAENAAVWLTEEAMIERALPFICQHLAVIIDKKEIVSTMAQAYQRIGNAGYGFGAFIAGPSKTADIEQSLVLGAHGAVSMTVFITDFTGNSLYSGR